MWDLDNTLARSSTRKMLFDNPYSYDLKSKEEHAEPFLSSLRANQADNFDNSKEGDRTLLDRVLSPLLIANYAIAGGIDGALKPDETAFGGAWEGIKASNPFGKGNPEGAVTFTDVLETAGWQPEGLAGKITKGTAGFVLDVALDPTTYLTGGASAIVKGTGRAGVAGKALTKTTDKMAKEVYLETVAKAQAEKYGRKKYAVSNEMVDKGKLAEEALRDSAKHGMSPEMAEKVIRDRGGFEQSIKLGDKVTPADANGVILRDTPGQVTDIQIRDGEKFYQVEGSKTFLPADQVGKSAPFTAEEKFIQATDFADEYNRILGFRKEGRITWGAGNLPFAPKSWRDNVIDLGTDKHLRAFGDKSGIAKLHGALRNNIYGGQIGKLFSNKSKLYKLGMDEPEKLWEAMSFLDITKGQKMDKVLEARAIKQFFDELDFTPAENKEIIELLQNKTVFHQVQEKVGFANLEKVKEIRKGFEKETKKTDEDIAKLKENRKIAKENTGRLDKMLNDEKTYKQILDEEFEQKLLELDTSTIKGAEKLKEVSKMYEEEIKKLVQQDKDNVVKATQEALEKEAVDVERIKELRSKSIDEDDAMTLHMTGKAGQKRGELERSKTQEEIAEGIKENLEDDIYKRTGGHSGVSKHKKVEPEPTQYEVWDRRMQELKHLERAWLPKNATKAEAKEFYSKQTQGRAEAAHIRKMREIQPSIDKRKAQELEDATSTYDKELASEQVFTVPGGSERGSATTKIVKASTAPTRKSTNELKEALGEYAFDDADKFKFANDQAIDFMMNVVEKGQPVDFIRSFYLRNKRLFDPHIKEVDMFVAEKLGYTAWHKEGFKEPMANLLGLPKTMVDEMSTNAIESLVTRAVDKNVLTPQQLEVYTELMQKSYQRTKYRDKYHTMDDKEFARFRTKEANKESYEEIFGGFEDEYMDARRAGFIDDDYMTAPNEYGSGLLHEMGDEFKLFNSSTGMALTKDEISRMNPSQLEIAVNEAKNLHPNMRPNEKQQKVLDEMVRSSKEYANLRSTRELVRDNEAKITFDNIAKAEPETFNKGIKKSVSEDTKTSFSDLEKNPALYDAEKGIVTNSTQRAPRLVDESPRAQREANKGNSEYLMHDIDTLTSEDFMTITGDLVKSKILSQTLIDKAGPSFASYLQVITRNLNDLTTNKFNRSYSDLTPGQKRYALSEATGKAQSVDKATAEVAKVVKKNSKNAKEIKKTAEDANLSKKSPEEIYKTSKISKANQGAKLELLRNLKSVNKQLEDLNFGGATSRTELVEKFEARIAVQEQNIKELESSHQEFSKLLKGTSEEDITRLQRKSERMEELYTNDEALETYMRASDKYNVDALLREANPVSVGEKWLESKASSQKVVDTVRELRQIFTDIGQKEAGIGKLSEGQIEANIMNYLPRIPTKDGEAFFRATKEFEKGTPKLTHDLGYGLAHNPHGKSRTTKGTVEEVNEYFRNEFPELLKGKNVFSENIADIYLARATSNLDLMYDDRYMRNMLETFGKEIPLDGALEKGYTAVMNFGMMRKTVQDLSAMQLSTKISSDVGDYIRVNSKRIYEMADSSGKDRAKLLDEHVEQFLADIFPEDVISAMFKEFEASSLTESKFPKKAMTDKALPMQELDADQVKGVQHTWDRVYKEHIDSMQRSLDGAVDREDFARVEIMQKRFDKLAKRTPPQVRQVNDTIVGMANQTRQVQRAKDENQLLQVYDKFLHFVKLNQTVVSPAFHTRNKTSNMFNNWLGIGADAVNKDYQIASTVLSKAGGDVHKIKDIIDNKRFGWKQLSEPIPMEHAHPSLKPYLKDGGMSWSDLYDLSLKQDVIESGLFARDIGAGGISDGLLKFLHRTKKDGSQVSFDPTDTANFKGYKVGTAVGETVENSDRMIHFMSAMKQGKSVKEATRSSKEFLFDYGDLTAFEQSTMKRIMPYYTWMRKNARLQLDQVIENPGKFRDVAKVIQGIEGMTPRDERMDKAHMADWTDDWLQLPFNILGAGGQEKKMLFNPTLPYMDISRLPDPSNIDESIRGLFAQTAPMIKLPFEYAMNYNTFFDDKIAQEGQNKVGKYADHAMSQLAPYNIAKGFGKEGGKEKTLHGLNAVTGVKLSAYDYERAKNDYYSNKHTTPIDDFVEARVDEAGNLVRKGASKVSMSALDGVGKLVGQEPMSADEYSGALRPISKDAYDKLSKEEKEQYTPPTKDEVTAYNKEAMRLSDEEYEKSGTFKKFAWSLLNSVDKRKQETNIEVGNVTRVIDGDTVIVNIGDKEERIRILLVDTPETQGEYEKNPMPYGQEATDYANEKLFGKDAKLHLVPESDTYGRRLAYVELEDGSDFNKGLIEEGLARVRFTNDDFPNNKSTYARTSEYFEAQRKAEREKKGVWSIDGYGGNPRKDEDFNEDALNRYLNKLNSK